MKSPLPAVRDAVRTLGLLRTPGLQRLLTIRFAGQFGDGLFQTALFSAVFFDPTRATSAGQAATGFATLLLPYSVIGPFAGVLLDRWSRQRVLLVSNLLRAVLIGVLSLLLAHLAPTSAPVVGVALVVISLNRFVLSGLSAALPHVVEERLLVTANSVSSTLGGGAAAAGGGTAVALRSVLGSDSPGAARVALFAAAVYLFAAAVARRVAVRELGPDDPPLHERLSAALSVAVRGLTQGATHVARRGPAARALAAISAHRFFYGLSFIATLLLYTDDGAIHLGLQGLGQVITTTVFGGLAAALVTPAVTRRLGTQRWIALAFALAAVFQAGVTPYTHLSLLLAGFGLGFAAQASKICVDTLLQETIEDDFRGRVFSFYDTLFNVSFVSAAGLAVVLVPPSGRSYAAVAVVAGGYALTAAAYSLATARRIALEPVEPVITAA